MNEDFIQSVERALVSRAQTHQRTAADGERWLDCRCPLHDDRHRSGSFSRDRGTFHCRVCSPGGSIPLERVALALAVPYPLGRNGDRADVTLQTPHIELYRAEYAYYWANGELSHHHVRIQYTDGSKTFRFRAPGGEWKRPETYWPLYGDLGCPKGAHILLVEGEKATDAVNSLELRLNDSPIRAITAGGTTDLGLAKDILFHRLAELEPLTVVLWPDNDEPGIKAMKQVHRHLSEHHLTVTLLEPEVAKMGDKEDVADFILKDGELTLLLQSVIAPVHHRGPTPKDITQQLTVLQSGGVLWPKTQFIVGMDQSNCNSLWQEIVGSMPTDRQAKEMLNLLRSRLATDPTRDYYRLYATSSEVIWRSDPNADCYRLSPQGIEREPEFHRLVLAPGEALVPFGVDVTEDPTPYRQLCRFFGLGELEEALLLAWCICVLCNKETPLLLMRGEANTGKSTLARFILGIVEPTLPEINASKRGLEDDRQLIRTLQKVPAILLDNVSVLSPDMEDTLSRLVTGYAANLRRLYSESVENVRMKRGVIITTTNWDIYKGDLATRVIVCQPHIKGGDRLADGVVEELFWPLMPQIRGYVFTQVCRFLRDAPLHQDEATPWRVAAFGWVLNTLGYDVRELFAQESLAKAALLNQNDVWMQAIIDTWEAENQGGEFVLSMSQIIGKMRDYGVPFEQCPHVNSPKFARWAEEKRMLLRDHGFYLERHRNEKQKGYWFRRVK